MSRLYLYPLPLRVWHWVNAFIIMVLIITGIPLRFSGVEIFLTYRQTVLAHKYFGFALTASFLFWLIYYLLWGGIKKHYLVRLDDMKGMPRQALYYAYTIFTKGRNPFTPSPEAKFNPLQKVAYVSVMFIFTPLIVATGILFSDVTFFLSVIKAMGGIRMLDALHVATGYVFLVYIFVHVYMSTLGPSPCSHIKTMITGYEEGEEEGEGGESLDFSDRRKYPVDKEETMSVGIVRDEIFLEHITDDYHPENPDRLKHIYAMLNGIDREGITYIPSRMATHEEIAMNHTMSYIEAIAATEGKAQRRLDPDTVTSPKSYEAARMAVGGVLELLDALMTRNVGSGFALVRPPGHHAESDRAMGFCIFNNIAIGARYLQKKYGLKRILIVDWDLHHGNGTQHSFYGEKEILYLSMHQYPHYPGTGWYKEVGEGDGKGFTVNVPLSYGMDDDDYGYVFRELVVPLSDLYKPEFVLVSAGFDTHRNDPLGGMAVTETGFAAMTKSLLDIAAKHCGGRTLFALEGGYDLVGLTNSVKAVITEMKGTPLYTSVAGGAPSEAIVKMVDTVKEVLEPYWGKL
jgi:acetoin utilization deacetylase AcuC-like enzyme/thiosulfate reductase cytochrome b subunit